MSTETQQDDFELPLATARTLVRKGQAEEACAVLAQARDRAVSRGELDDAALFSSVRGSYLVIIGMNCKALEAYLEAERLANGDVHKKLATARHLIYGMEQPVKALEKVREVLEIQSNSAAVRQESYAIQGLARLFMKQSEEAVGSMEVVLSEVSTARLPSISCDLTLVEELARRRLAPELCRSYLEVVETKAKGEKEDRVLRQLSELKTLLPE